MKIHPFNILVQLFPLGLLLASFLQFYLFSALLAAWGLLITLYVVPALCCRLLVKVFSDSKTAFDLKKPSAWWMAHHVQSLYSHLPFLEGLLRLLPGAYSAWLRLWGSQVGCNIIWSPGVTVADRHLLRLGSNIVFGYKSFVSGHLIRRKENGLYLFLSPVHVGNHVLLGAFSKISPGAYIADGENVEMGAVVKPGKR